MGDTRTDPPLTPEDPSEAGVPARSPDESRIEGAHVLASEARERLAPQGFTEEQILDWAEAFVAEEGNGDVDMFVDWIARQEGTRS